MNQQNYRDEIAESISVWNNLKWKEKIIKFRQHVKVNIVSILEVNKNLEREDFQFLNTKEAISENNIFLLKDFDIEYFKELEGPKWWIAINQNNCSNQRYFTVFSKKWIKLWIIWVYDANVLNNEINVCHTIVDPNFRWKGYAMKFKEEIMKKLNLPFLTLTISTDNISSIKAAEKLPWTIRLSNKSIEDQTWKIVIKFPNINADKLVNVR